MSDTEVEKSEQQDDEVEYLGGFRYLARAMVPSSPSGWMIAGFTLLVVAILTVSLIRLFTKEVPDPPPPPPPPAASLEVSFDGRKERSQQSLYRARSTPWAAQSRELALAFYDDRWQDRLDDILPESVMDQVRSSDWPIGTLPLITDYGKEGDPQGYSKISFQEGWSVYLIVELQEDRSFAITGVEFDRESVE